MYTGRRNAAAAGSSTTTAVVSATTTNNNGSSTMMNGGARGGAGKRGGASSSSNAAAAADFHPKLIFSQMVCLQCFHYFWLAVLLQINSFLYGQSVTLDRIFTDDYLRVWHVAGWPDACAVLLTSLVGSVWLAIVVEKSKKCLDFSATLFLVHLLLCTYYSGGLPRTADWWIVHVAGTILMVVVGEYLCSRREMEDIPLLQL